MYIYIPTYRICLHHVYYIYSQDLQLYFRILKHYLHLVTIYLDKHTNIYVRVWKQYLHLYIRIRKRYLHLFTKKYIELQK